MSAFAAGLMFGVLVAIGVIALARFMRDAAEQREREARYADEWVRRHRREEAQ